MLNTNHSLKTLLGIESENILAYLESSNKDLSRNSIIALSDKNLYIKSATPVGENIDQHNKVIKLPLNTIESFAIIHKNVYLTILAGLSSLVMLVLLKLFLFSVIILSGVFSYYTNRYIKITTEKKSYLVKIAKLNFQEYESFRISILTAIHNLPGDG